MGETPRISEAEWEVMKVLWQRHPMSATEVWGALGDERDWTERTVKTLLSRLVQKGALEFEQEGRRYLYSPCIERDEAIDDASRSFLDRVFGGSVSPMVSWFVRSGNLSPEDREALRRALDEAEEDDR